jgi:hypothetical protein
VQGKPRKATPLAIAKTVLSAFFGVRRRGDHEEETVQLKPAQIIVAGIIAGLVFVVTLLLLARFIIGKAMG